MVAVWYGMVSNGDRDIMQPDCAFDELEKRFLSE